MQIAIDMPEELYNYMLTEAYDEYMDKRFDYQVRFAVKNGIPLPKGHGRLIDERQITECKQVGLIIQDGAVTRCLVTDAPTILEAERQSLKQIKEKRGTANEAK